MIRAIWDAEGYRPGSEVYMQRQETKLYKERKAAERAERAAKKKKAGRELNERYSKRQATMREEKKKELASVGTETC